MSARTGLSCLSRNSKASCQWHSIPLDNSSPIGYSCFEGLTEHTHCQGKTGVGAILRHFNHKLAEGILSKQRAGYICITKRRLNRYWKYIFMLTRILGTTKGYACVDEKGLWEQGCPEKWGKTLGRGLYPRMSLRDKVLLILKQTTLSQSQAL